MAQYSGRGNDNDNNNTCYAKITKWDFETKELGGKTMYEFLTEKKGQNL